MFMEIMWLTYIHFQVYTNFKRGIQDRENPEYRKVPNDFNLFLEARVWLVN